MKTTMFLLVSKSMNICFFSFSPYFPDFYTGNGIIQNQTAINVILIDCFFVSSVPLLKGEAPASKFLNIEYSDLFGFSIQITPPELLQQLSHITSHSFSC